VTGRRRGRREIEIEGRPIPTARYADGIAWFDFKALCDKPKWTIDYIEIARCFHTVFIANIPQMGDEEKDQAARFIRLVDALYDHNVNLVASAAAVPTELYTSRSPLAFDFTRTASRLEECAVTTTWPAAICPSLVALPALGRR